MNRKLLLLLTTAGLTFAAAACVWAPSGAAVSNSYLITGAKSIDGYQVGSGFSAARQLFGGPYSETQSSTTCIARWTHGLTIAWRRRLPYLKWEKACLVFNWAKITGKLWRTDKGLRVGSSESQLKKLYDGAVRKSSGRYTVWSLARSSRISLQAWAKDGRVVSFWLVRR